MHTVTLKLVTIVAERLFREKVQEELRKLGAKGFTVTDAVGQGSRGVRASEWEGRNVRIETVVPPEVADRIVEHVAERYFEHYAVIVWVQSVDVVRGDKYL
jgi:nitrogen regulatory protein PII